jgi:hypothetical protein
MEQILYIFFGWLLGLLGQPIGSRVEKYFKRKELKILIVSELKGLVFRLVALRHNILSHRGLLDNSSISWLKHNYEKCQPDCSPEMLGALDKLLEALPADLKALANYTKAPEGTSISLKTFTLPFTESVINQLWILESEMQALILEVRSQVAILNEEIDNARFYHRLSFDTNCMETNRQIVIDNLNMNYDEIQKKCKFIVDSIEKKRAEFDI